jgi:hypothetical protein
MVPHIGDNQSFFQLGDVTQSSPDNQGKEKTQPEIIPLVSPDYNFKTLFNKSKEIHWCTPLLCSKEIKEFGLRIQVFFEDNYSFVLKDVPDFAARVQEVSEFPGTGGAYFHTFGIKTFSYPLDTKGTFFYYPFIPGAVSQEMGIGIHFFRRYAGFSPIKMSGAVRTSCHAAAAADAPIVIYHYNTVRFLPGGPHRAGFHTWGIFTLLTLNW